MGVATSDETASPRRAISKPALLMPYWIEVDRQLKSGYDTYEAAEAAALAVKQQYPRLNVTVYEIKTGQRRVVLPSGPATAADKNRAQSMGRNGARRNAPAAGTVH